MGNWATPGYVSPFVQGGGIRSDARNSGTAANAALRGISGPIGGGFTRSFGGIGPSGPRIDARPQLSPNTGRGLADFYANQAMPSEFDRLQQRAERQQAWVQGQNFPQRIADNRQRAQALSANAFSGGSNLFGGMASGQSSLPALGGLGGNFSNFSNIQGQVQWRQKGGPVKDIQPYIVNEEGPEAYQPKGGKPMLIPGPMQLFVPPVDGKIIPHKKTMQMMGKSMGTKSPQPKANGGNVFVTKGSENSYFRSGPWRSALDNSSGAGPISTSPIRGNARIPFGALGTGSFGDLSFQRNMMNGIIPNPANPVNPFGMQGAGTRFTVRPLEFRARGGPVQGSGMPAPQQFSNPWAAKWAMSRAQPQAGAFADTYESLYQQGASQGIDMTNAPQTVSGLRRYLGMGQRDIGATQAGRAAARQSLANSAPQAGPPSFLEYGQGAVQFTPQLTEFYNDQGQSFPWAAPVDDPWQTTWLQDRQLSGAQGRTHRERPNSRRRDPVIEAEFEEIYDQFSP